MKKKMMKGAILAMAVMSVVVTAGAQPVAPERGIFRNGGFFVGCNYWAKNAGMYMWSRWRPDVIEKELAELSKNGVEVMRVFPLWSDFQPLTGDCHAGGAYRSYRFRDNRPLPNWAGVDDEMIARFAWFCDCAERNGIKLIVGILTGWMSGRQFVPEVFEEKNVLSDPGAVMWGTRFAKYFVNALKDKKAIVAWDYGNECNCMGANDQAAFYNWMDHIAMAIRSQDATRPIVSGMHGLSTSEFASAPIRLNGEISDILCTHPYAFYVPGCGKEAFNTMRTALHPTAESLLYRDLGGKPCFIEEIGNLGASCNSDARTAAGMRTTMFSAWANDLKGCLWWCNSDQEVLEFPPYELTACERELGLLRQDYTPKPVMREMKAFQDFRASLPFARLSARKTDAVIVVPEKSDGWQAAFGAYLLCKQASIEPVFAGAERELPEAPFYVVCSSESDMSYSYPAQKRVFAKAKAGATVLVVYSAAGRFTALREQTGLEADYCCLTPMTRTFALAAQPERTMAVSDDMTCCLVAHECEVLAKSTDGQPMLTRFAYGKGTVCLINGPVDRQTVARTDVVQGEKVMPYYLLFREAAKGLETGRKVVKGDCPYVGITEHPQADGTTVVIAINFEPREMECPVRLSGALCTVWRGDVTADRIRLAPNEAAVFLVK